MFWIVGKTGVLSRAFQKVFLADQIPFFVSSQQECDIRNLKQIQEYIRGKTCQYIINCSAYTAVDLAEQQPLDAIAVNATGVEHLAQIAQSMGAKLIHFSTDYVFDGRKHTPYTEEDPTYPLNVYGKSKVEGEKILVQQFPSALILRISWLFSQEGPSFMNTMWKAMIDQQEIQVVVTQIGKPTYAYDVVAVVREILGAQGIYHCANDDPVSRYDYAQEIYAELKNQGVRLKCQQITPISGVYGTVLRPEYSVLGTEKIEGLLQHPMRSHKTALKECISYRTLKEKHGVA